MPPDRCDPRIRPNLRARKLELTDIAVKQGMTIEPQRMPVEYAMLAATRADPKQRAIPGKTVGIKLLHLREQGKIGFNPVEYLALLRPGMDQKRHRHRHRQISEPVRRALEKGPARQGQRSNQGIAKSIMEHGRAPAGRVEPDRVFRLEHGDLAMLAERGGGGETDDTAANNNDVAGRAQAKRS
jgi:hypothetical protein